MKFDARSERSPEKKAAFVAWLTGETVSTLERASGDPEKLKSAAFLLVNRAREAALIQSELAEVIGVSVARAGLQTQEEESFLDFVEAFDPLATAVHTPPANRKPWWRFW